MPRERAHADKWLRDVTPSADLRHWHHHDQERFAEFGDRYIGELEDADHRPAVRHLRDLTAHEKSPCSPPPLAVRRPACATSSAPRRSPLTAPRN
ncbi:DUF488 family protein, N3 subclade [Streptomyces sp. NPDC001811]